MIRLTKEEIKAVTTVPNVLRQYGVEVKRGRCKAICHHGDNYTAKVSDELYYCFKCNKSMDIFDITMHFNQCDFKTAFELLGGFERPSFKAYLAANRAKNIQEQSRIQDEKNRAYLRKIRAYITAYRNLIAESEPLSDLWCYCYNKLQYQIYLLELHDEKR